MGTSRILVVGGTGKVGQSVSLASVRLGHPTFLLVRDPSPSDPAKAELLNSFKAHGGNLVKGDLTDAASLVEALKLVDIVISVVGSQQTLDQLTLLDAIVQVGTIKRFIPSEFSNYPGTSHPILDEVFQNSKDKVKKAIEKSGVPYTYVISGAGATWYLRTLWQDEFGLKSPPRDKVTIYGDGNAKAVVIDNDDLGTYTILAADDPRAANKYLYLRPEGIYKSQNELVAIWEEKIGHALEKTYVSDEQMKKIIDDSPYPKNFFLALKHMFFVQGFKSDLGTDGVEASALYPDVKYTSASEYLDRFV